MSNLFLWIKWVHILSATVLFGTGLGTAFHLFATHLRGDVSAIAVAARNTVIADWLFTAISGVVQPLTGLLMIQMARYDYFESWLVATYAFYAVAVACWLKVVQLQYRIREYAIGAVERGECLPREYHRAMKLWFILGWPAFASLVIVMALMVMKPEIW